MGSTTTNQQTSTSGSSNPAVNATATTLAQKLGGLANQPAPFFNQSTYQPAGQTTQNSWATALTAANNPAFTGGINGTISSLGNIASGNDFGTNDPTYAALRAQNAQQALDTVGSQFTNSGRFGGDSYLRAAGEGVTNALDQLDYTNYQNDQQRQMQAANLLPQTYQAAQLPAEIQAGVGSAQDQNQQGILSGQADLYNRQNTAPLSWLQGITSAAAGNAASAGQTTTQSQQVPWWMAGLGALSTGAGVAGSFRRPF
jgi:hypothetical protein